MALYPPGKPEKLIFAPSPLSTPGTPAPAGQFTRHETGGGLRRVDLDPADPVPQFHEWYAAAQAAGVGHPETCTLSTASLPSGRVSARVVYLKELDRQGFVLYSNFGTSGKARDLFGGADDKTSGSEEKEKASDSEDKEKEKGNRWAALTFWWEALERQVRVEGRAARLTAAESQVYFDTRVRGSRIGAWSSRQSAVLEPRAEGVEGQEGQETDDGRAQLDQWVAETEARFGKTGEEPGATATIPVPEFWGGLRIVPERVEFWQGRQNRLHDRFVYDRVAGVDGGADTWMLKRLSP